MATKRTGQKSAASSHRITTRKPSYGTKPPVALTVKVDDQTYVRLCTWAATQRRTNQDLLHEAVQHYLNKVGA